MLILFGALCFGFPVLLSARRGIMAPSFLFHLYMLCGICIPYSLIVMDVISDAATIIDLRASVVHDAFLMMCIANVICFLTCALTIGQRRMYAMEHFEQASFELVRRFSVVAITLGLVYLSAMLAILGGPQAFISATFKRVAIENSTANYASVLFWGAYVCSVAAYHFQPTRGRRSRKRFSPILLVCLAFTTLLSFSLGGRSTVVILLLALASKHLVTAKISRQFVRLLFLGLIAASISVGMLRLRFYFQHATAATSDKGPIVTAITGVTFVDHIAQAMNYTAAYGMDYGLRYISLPATVVPRGLWPDKPIPISQQLRGFVYGDTTGGVPPGLFGEAYMAFGFLGVMAAAVVWGGVLAETEKNLDRARFQGAPYYGAKVAVLAPLVGYAFVRGGTDIGLYRAGIPFFWCVAIGRYLKYREIGSRSRYIRVLNSPKL